MKAFMSRWFGGAAPPEKKQRRQREVRFAAAQQGRLGPRIFGGLSINQELQRDLATIKAQSKRAGNDDGYVVKFLNMCETHVVGPDGFTMYVNAEDARGNQDAAASTAVQKAFERWGKKGVCDTTGQYSWIDIQNMFIRTVAEGGEILVRYVDGFPNEFGFALQLIDCDMLQTGYNRDLADGNRIRMGVELDDYDRPQAVHILTRHPGDTSYLHGSTQYQRIPVSEIALSFMPFRLHQVRGVPWAHAALLEMHHLTGYREAELTGARIAASKMLAYEPDPDLESDDALVQQDFIEEVDPGMSVIAPPGYQIKTLDFKTDGNNFGSYIKHGMRGAASGLDVSYNNLANDLEGVNFSSLRQAVLEDRDGWKKRQRWMRETLLEPVFSRWLRMALLSGMVQGYGLRHLEQLDRPKFQGRRWPWVDPLKDEQANTEGIDNLTRSPLDIIREQGKQPEQVANDLVMWEAMIEQVRAKRAKYGPNQQQNSNKGESNAEDGND